MQKDFYSEYFRIEDAHWWFVGRREIFLRLLRDHLPAPREEGRRLRILDVGCGTGTMLGHLRRFGDVAGIDADEAAIGFCRARGVTEARLVRELPLPFDDGSFDAVTALDVLEHVDDDRALLAELRRVTRPGGLVLLSVPAYRFLWGPQDEINHHKRRYVASEIRGLAAGVGLRVARLSYMNTLLFPVIAGIRVARSFLPRPAELRSDFAMTKPGLSNRLLGRLFALEAPLVARVDLPFGVSIVAVAFR